MFKITAILFISYLHFVICQFRQDYFVFTAHLTCKIPEKQNFRYQIEYFEYDLLSLDDKITRFDNVGNGTEGQAISNNFGVMFGDGFLDDFYEIYALILHDCTKKPNKMKQYTLDLDTCSTLKTSCINHFRLDITELGDEVEAKKIPIPQYYA